MLPAITWKHILVPVDFSEHSQQAVQIAAYLASQCAAKITLLHVLELPAFAPVEAHQAMDASLKSANNCLDELAEDVPTPLMCDVSSYLSTEGVVPGIVEAAREYSADLIIIAPHQSSWFRRIIHGSHTDDLLNRAPCAVLVVRSPKTASH